MPAIVNKVIDDSIAKELEIQSGDEIVSIDGIKMSDMIDYNFLCKSEILTIEVKKANGEIEEIELEKDFEEDLGIVFESAVFDKVKPCLNKCIFCFVDQQPEGLRETLYIKDDDYRLSYLQGTYVTLTNLSDADKKRIENLGLGPFYVSVHTTNPDLRIKMLKNPNAGKIMQHLKWLEGLDIPLHLQIVLCPGLNDGEELKKTLADFKKLKNILSVAVVPVGITKYRKDDELLPVTKEIAAETIRITEEFNQSSGGKFFGVACCSDEFFELAELPVPSVKYYGNFSQLEDGVGALRLLLDDFEKEKKRLPERLNSHKNILFATSKLAKPAIDIVAEELNKIEHLSVKVLEVKSDYWGDKISVAGLITSDDLIKSLLDFTVSDLQYTIIIPSVMLRQYTQDFLDGKNLDYVREKTKMNFVVVENYYSTKEIVDFVISEAV